jgi:hypothetical protein
MSSLDAFSAIFLSETEQMSCDFFKELEVMLRAWID